MKPSETIETIADADQRPSFSEAELNGVVSIRYLPTSHLDLFWLGSDKTCLARGAEVIKEYLDRCLKYGETFLIDTTVFAADFLERHPEYREPLLDLVHQGRVEIGAAFIDRWETLVPAESLIRNAQVGQRWCIDNLGAVNPLASHPDLPSFTPQTAQIYHQCGIRYYVTSRKIFPKGQVWRYRAPDGSDLLVLSYPCHYNFVPMKREDLPETCPIRDWALPMDLEAAKTGFPRGTILVSGGAGDLTSRDTFKARLGRYLEEFVDLFRKEYRDIDFGYGTVGQVLSSYDGGDAVPVRSEAIPSVWGVAADEEVTFFQRDRELERALLNLETIIVAAGQVGVEWRPSTADQWTGVFHDRAFFGRKHPISAGHELEEIWRMHLFTQDHNGGGQEGVLSTFRKRTIQEAALQYCAEGICHALKGIGIRVKTSGRKLLVFNPHGQPWSGPVRLPAGENSSVLGADGKPLSTVRDPFDGKRRITWVDGVPSVGYQIFGLSSNSQDAELSLSKANSEVSLETEHFKVAFSRETGAMVQLLDKSRNIDWGHERCGRLTGVRESGNDVTLRIASDAEVASDSLEGIQIEEENGLYVSVLVRRRFLKCSVEQRIVLWKTEARIDFETRIFWYGARDWQVRMSLPLASSRADISHGMAFYGANWNTIAPGAGPHNPDELLPEDYACYREVLDWVHLTKGDAGLSIITDHPAFHATNNELSAVLLRTATSCGDIGWLWWENAGEQVFRFTFVPGQGNWNEAKVPQRAAAILRPPQVQIAESTGGELEKAFSFLSVDGGAMVSAIYPGKDSKKINLRIVEPIGKSAEVMFNGPLARGSAELTDLLGNPKGSPTGDSGRWSVSLKPWTIQTIQFSQ